MRINPYTKYLPMKEPEGSKVSDLENRVSFNPVKKIFNDINASQIASQNSQQAFALGETDSIHKVVVDMEDALMSMKLATQVRNKAVEAYQDVMRMQV